MIVWKSLWALFLIFPLLAGLVWIFLRDSKRRTSLQFGSLQELKKITPSLRVRLRWLPLVLKSLGLVLLIVAMARPQKADEMIKQNVEGIDIVVTLDISDSMLIEDMKPLNRLESAKDVIRNFVKGRVSDRIGLVVFMGEAFTKIPPTLDYELLIESIAEIQPSRSMKMGTAIGVALANSVARLKDSTAKSRVVIFLTDGENNSGSIDPETALEIAKGYGVKIYSIGIGKDGETQIPVITTDPFGNQVKRYQPFFSTVNEDLLKRYATETGGKYWRATRTTSLQDVFSEIDRLEKTKIEVNKYTKYTELFPAYLEWGLFIYLLGWFLGFTWLRRVP